jgi:hypothetical protein
MAGGMPFSEAVDLIRMFVGTSQIVRGNVLAAQDAMAIMRGLRSIEKLNPFNRDAAMKDLIAGKVRCSSLAISQHSLAYCNEGSDSWEGAVLFPRYQPTLPSNILQ